jgi:hypothetical protein
MIVDLARQVGELHAARVDDRQLLEEIRDQIVGIPNGCALRQAECRKTIEKRLDAVEEQAKAVGRARIISSWLTWAAVGAGGLAISGLGVYEVGSRHGWW